MQDCFFFILHSGLLDFRGNGSSRVEMFVIRPRRLMSYRIKVVLQQVHNETLFLFFFFSFCWSSSFICTCEIRERSASFEPLRRFPPEKAYFKLKRSWCMYYQESWFLLNPLLFIASNDIMHKLISYSNEIIYSPRYDSLKYGFTYLALLIESKSKADPRVMLMVDRPVSRCHCATTITPAAVIAASLMMWDVL